MQPNQPLNLDELLTRLGREQAVEDRSHRYRLRRAILHSRYVGFRLPSWRFVLRPTLIVVGGVMVLTFVFIQIPVPEAPTGSVAAPTPVVVVTKTVHSVDTARAIPFVRDVAYTSGW